MVQLTLLFDHSLKRKTVEYSFINIIYSIVCIFKHGAFLVSSIVLYSVEI